MNLIYFHCIVILIGFMCLSSNYVVLSKNGGLKRFGEFISDPNAIEEYWILQKSKLIRHVVTSLIFYSYILFSIFRVLNYFDLWNLEVVIFFIMLSAYLLYTVSYIRAAQTINEFLV